MGYTYTAHSINTWIFAFQTSLMQKIWLKTHQGRKKYLIPSAPIWDPSWETKNFHQKARLGLIISYFGSENDHILLIFMGHMQNDICISNSPENILSLMVLFFVIPLISVLWLGFRPQNQPESHQNRHFFLILKNNGMGHKKLAFWIVFGNMEISRSIWL